MLCNGGCNEYHDDASHMHVVVVACGAQSMAVEAFTSALMHATAAAAGVRITSLQVVTNVTETAQADCLRMQLWLHAWQAIHTISRDGGVTTFLFKWKCLYVQS